MTKRKTKRVVVVGSRSFPISPEIGAEIVNILRGYPDGTVFLTRGSPGFDTFLMAVCPIIGYTALAYPSKGGADNFLRDVQLAKDADEGLVFLDPDSLGNINTGTAHVMEKLLDQKKKTKAYSVAGRTLVYAGSND